ncbi:MAG: zf-HC2 domain-containing protein [Actinomycetota bacterium]
MNEHEQVQEMLALAAAGALDESDLAQLQTHLRGCRECAARLRSLREVAATLGSLPVPQPSLGLAARTRVRVAGEMAARAERQRQHLLIGLLIGFGWVLTLLMLFAARYFAGDLAELLHISFTEFALGFISYSLLAALASAGFAAVIGSCYADRRRIL